MMAVEMNHMRCVERLLKQDSCELLKLQSLLRPHSVQYDLTAVVTTVAYLPFLCWQ